MYQLLFKFFIALVLVIGFTVIAYTTIGQQMTCEEIAIPSMSGGIITASACRLLGSNQIILRWE
jgi:heme/copper-type cytochrome/quinol oxidase subunit 4